MHPVRHAVGNHIGLSIWACRFQSWSCFRMAAVPPGIHSRALPRTIGQPIKKKKSKRLYLKSVWFLQTFICADNAAALCVSLSTRWLQLWKHWNWSCKSYAFNPLWDDFMFRGSTYKLLTTSDVAENPDHKHLHPALSQVHNKWRNSKTTGNF